MIVLTAASLAVALTVIVMIASKVAYREGYEDGMRRGHYTNGHHKNTRERIKAFFYK